MSNASEINIDRSLQSTAKRLRAELDREKDVTAEAIRALEEERAVYAEMRKSAKFARTLLTVMHTDKTRIGELEIAEIVKQHRDAFDGFLKGDAGRELAERMKGLEKLCDRAEKIMSFHAMRCPLNPTGNFSGSEEHLSEYRAVIQEIKQALEV